MKKNSCPSPTMNESGKPTQINYCNKHNLKSYYSKLNLRLNSEQIIEVAMAAFKDSASPPSALK